MTLSPEAISSFDDDENLRVVVETPRGSNLKYEFDPQIGAFTVSRQLSPGLAYPYDWGFIPGTRADDGDPLDAMVLHPQPTFPGMVLPCRPLGMVMVEQKEDGPWITNNRVLMAPAWKGFFGEAEPPRKLSRRQIVELEQFFVNTSYFTAKKIRIAGWRGAGAALALVKQLRI